MGHTGTLDPNATGVLPLLLNDGTKLSKYLIEHDKEYEVTLKLGIKTDTADIEGNIIEEKEVENIDVEQIEETLKSFIGKQEQLPPMYSAIKINGKKLYEYARNGEKVEINARNIEIYKISLINFNNKENEIEFKVSCSKGTYIRSLCEDIAKKLNTIGYMKELKRTIVGKFKIENAITLEELESNSNYIKEKVITMEKLLSNLPSINLNEKQIEKFLNGVQLSVNEEDGIYNIYTNKYLGTGIVKNRKVKRDIILK